MAEGRSEYKNKDCEDGDSGDPIQQVGSFENTFNELAGITLAFPPSLGSGLLRMADEPEAKFGWSELSSPHATKSSWMGGSRACADIDQREAYRSAVAPNAN